MQLVGARLRDRVENAAARAAEFHAEVAGSNRHLLNRVGNGEYLFLAGEPNLIIIRYRPACGRTDAGHILRIRPCLPRHS